MSTAKIKSIRWDITNKCNLRCLHCYTVDNPGLDISYSHALQIIEKLLPLGLEEINFSGREPTLWNDLAEIIKICCANNLRVNVTTNGTILEREGLISLLNTGMNMLVFSLDGVSNSIHDKVRGVGSFHKTIRSILICSEYIRENSIPAKIGISCTMQKINAPEISYMIDLCDFFGIQFLSINPVSFCGSAAEVKRVLRLSADETLECWFRICEEYKRIKPKYDLFLGTFPMETKLLNMKYGLELPVIHTACSAGSTLYIDSCGRALPCYMLPSVACEMNIFKKYLCYWDIINEPIAYGIDLFAPFISYAQTISKKDHHGCADCTDVHICKGCPLIIESDPDAIHRCQVAQKKLAAIKLDLSNNIVPAIKKTVSWELSDNILHLSLHKEDYSSDKKYQLDNLTRSIWLKIDAQSSIINIKKSLRTEFALFSSEKIRKAVNNFMDYFCKEGVLQMRGSDG